jgi:hypothetical protein
LSFGAFCEVRRPFGKNGNRGNAAGLGSRSRVVPPATNGCGRLSGRDPGRRPKSRRKGRAPDFARRAAGCYIFSATRSIPFPAAKPDGLCLNLHKDFKGLDFGTWILGRDSWG